MSSMTNYLHATNQRIEKSIGKNLEPSNCLFVNFNLRKKGNQVIPIDQVEGQVSYLLKTNWQRNSFPLLSETRLSMYLAALKEPLFPQT